MNKDKDLINFSQDHELNSFLRSEGKRETAENRKTLKSIGDECKKKLNKRILKTADFHQFLEKNKALKGKLEDKK
ncbi:hypothetical protein [Oceanivirga salmonicida]|uniref:hypothetical protein n=1 Tax=Oceanivirga salmonicida TaxID=1769291 RepID=UPI00082EAB0E|nr:hypothetical protein [Oceanivirga salmonicida]